MRMQLGLESVKKEFVTILEEELKQHTDKATVFYEDGNTVVVMEGNVVECECVVAICDKYRFSEGVKPVLDE